MAQHLTDAIVKRLPAPEKGNRVVYDDDVPGFGCRVTAGGARSFILNYRVRGTGRERRYTIGSAVDWQTTAARAEAKRLRRLIAEGGDPLADLEDERAAPTVGDLMDRFEAEHLPRKRPGTAADYKRMLNNHVRPALKHLKVAEVAFSDIDRLHRKITNAGHPYRANRVIAVVSKMFSLAQRWGMRDTNPCKGVERNYEAKRKRYLSGEELARLTAALTEHPDKHAANVMRVLLLTGARRGEVLAMRWADIDLGAGTWTKPGSTTKQKTDHVVPLSGPARQLLSEIRDEQTGKHRQPLGEYVFPGNGSTEHIVNVKRAWRRICKAAGIEGLRIHDLRHSFASQLASGGASLPLIGALLGHSNPTTTHRYSHLFDDPQRAAVERVGVVIAAAGQPGKEPAPMKGRGA
jgi:integrase